MSLLWWLCFLVSFSSLVQLFRGAGDSPSQSGAHVVTRRGQVLELDHWLPTAMLS